MPSLANMTVKKNDGTTDITYAAVQPATGESPAVFLAPSVGATADTRPELRIKAVRDARGTVARITGTYMYPYSVQNTTTGVTTIEKRIMGRFEFMVPQGIPTSSTDEAVSQGCNLVAHTLFKSCAKEGFAPS